MKNPVKNLFERMTNMEKKEEKPKDEKLSLESLAARLAEAERKIELLKNGSHNF